MQESEARGKSLYNVLQWGNAAELLQWVLPKEARR